VIIGRVFPENGPRILNLSAWIFLSGFANVQ
jgi:hypothetical protein